VSGSRVVVLDELGGVQDILEHSAVVSAAAWAHTHAAIAVATHNQHIHLYSPSASTQPQLPHELEYFSKLPNSIWHHNTIIELDYTPQQLCWVQTTHQKILLLAAADFELSLWEIDNLKPVALVWHAEHLFQHSNALFPEFLDVSSDGRLVALGVKDSKTVLVSNMTEQSPPAELILPCPPVSVSWHMAGRAQSAGNLPNVLKIHTSDGRITLWKESVISTQRLNAQGVSSSQHNLHMYCASQITYSALFDGDRKFISSSWLENLHVKPDDAIKLKRFESEDEDRQNIKKKMKQHRFVASAIHRAVSKVQHIVSEKKASSFKGSGRARSFLANLKIHQNSKSNLPEELKESNNDQSEDKSDYKVYSKDGALFSSTNGFFKGDYERIDDQNSLFMENKNLLNSQNDSFFHYEQFARTWISVIDDQGNFTVLAVYNIFSNQPENIEVCKFVVVPNVVSESVLKESPSSMISTATFSNPFFWQRAPQHKLESLLCESNAYSSYPSFCRVYLVSKSDSEISLRSWSVSLNEASSIQVSKIGGHSAKIKKLQSHAVLPFIASLSYDGHISIWKMDFPHIYSALDQERSLSGMYQMISFGKNAGDEKTYTTIDWYPHRSRLLLICMSSYTDSIDFFGPSDSLNQEFCREDEPWKILFSLKLSEVLHVYDIKARNCISYSTIETHGGYMESENEIILCLASGSFAKLYKISIHNQTRKTIDPVLTIDCSHYGANITAFDLHPAVPRRYQSEHQSIDLVLGLSNGKSSHVHVHLKSMEGVIRNVHMLEHSENPAVVKASVVSTTHFITSSDTEMILWEADSLSTFDYRKSLAVQVQYEGSRLLYSYCVLGDGAIRIVTAEQNLQSNNSGVAELSIQLHLPLRGAAGRESANIYPRTWKSINIDLSRYLHRYHRYSRGKSIFITGLHFASHGSLIIALNDSICYIPTHRLFLQDEETCILPVPLYHPAFLQELLIFGRVPVVKLILSHLLKACEAENTEIVSLEPSLDKILEIMNSNEFSQNNTCEAEFTVLRAKKLSEILALKRMPFITSRDNLQLLAIIATVLDVESQKQALDEFGIRFYVAQKMINFLNNSIRKAQTPQAISSVDIAWAMHSRVQESLLGLSLEEGYDWNAIQSSGLVYWLSSDQLLRQIIEKVAITEYQKRKNPLDAMLFYLILNKLGVLLGLFKISRSDPQMEEMYKIFSRDYELKENFEFAVKLAFGFKSKMKFKTSAGFFLLAGKPELAAKICSRDLQDFQLAFVISRLFRMEESAKIELQTEICEVVTFYAREKKDIWLEHIGLWLSNRKGEAIERLLVWDHSSIIFRPDAAFFLKQLSNPSISKAKSIEFSISIQQSNTINFESAKEYTRLGWSILAIHQMLQLQNLSSSEDPESDEAKAMRSVFDVQSANAGHSISQLHQDIIHSCLSMRTALKTRLPPFEVFKRRKQRIALEEDLKSKISKQVAPKNPFGFSFATFESESDDEEDKTSNLKSIDSGLDQEFSNSDGSSFNLFDEIKILKQNFQFDENRAIESVKRFSRAHHLFLQYLDVQVALSQNKGIYGIIRSELDSLRSLIHTSNIASLPMSKCRRLISCAEVFNTWRTGLVEYISKCSDPLESAVIFAQNIVVQGLIWISLFIACISQNDHKGLFAVIDAELEPSKCDSAIKQILSNQSEDTATSWVERYKYDYGDYAFADKIHSRNSSTDMLSEKEVSNLADGLFLNIVTHKFLVKFERRYLDFTNQGKSRDDPNLLQLRSIYVALLTWWDEACRTIPDRIGVASDYCKRSLKARIRLRDILAPLNEIDDSTKRDLASLIGYDEFAKKISQEIEQKARNETSSGYFGEAIELYKENNSNHIVNICYNKTNPNEIVLLLQHGIHELDLELSLKIPKDGQNNYNLLELDDQKASNNIFQHDLLDDLKLPAPVLRGCLLGQDNPLRNHYLSAKSVQLYKSFQMYDKFSKAYLKKLAQPVERKDSFIHAESHPYLPFCRFYIIAILDLLTFLDLTSHSKDMIHAWEFKRSSPLVHFLNPSCEKISKVRFSPSGNKFAACCGTGKLCIWNFDFNSTGIPPVSSIQAHGKSTYDCAFLNSDSLLCTVGSSRTG
jgi:hypothetical protein